MIMNRYPQQFAFWPITPPHTLSNSFLCVFAAGRRVLYRWSPPDFQFAALWLLQAAAALQQHGQSQTALSTLHECDTSIHALVSLLKKKWINVVQGALQNQMEASEFGLNGGQLHVSEGRKRQSTTAVTG